jgi:hypothetical protein
MRVDRDPRARTSWRSGPAAASPGPFFISYTEYTPRHAADVVGIYLAARRLMAECAELEGAVGLATYWQLRRWRGGSLSVWEGPEALRRFVRLPFHIEIMRRYRSRGTVQSTEWWSDSFDLAQGLADGQRRVVDAS